jgi:hypothetical protein
MRLRALILLLAVLSPLIAQDEARQIWDEGFRQKRPAPARRAASPAKKIAYRASQPGTTAKTGGALVGVTVWRLRSGARGDENAARLLVPDTPGGTTTEYVPERVPVSGKLREGDRVRLAIEVPQDGYLYVIDRERYNDGGFSDPYLIFPALNLSKGDNRVTAGRLVEIPAQSDPVPALRLERQSDRQIGEELLVIVTQKPIENLPLGTRPIKLAPEMVAGWERSWGSTAKRLDLVSGGEQNWTMVEKQAGGSDQRLLTQDDPMPQAIFQLASPPNTPLLVRVPLEVNR